MEQTGGLAGGSASNETIVPETIAAPTWGDALRVWLRIAAWSFGGPAGQISVMHRILVEERRWIPERTFQQALSFCLLLPGPEAHQLVTYTGWMLRGWPGGLCAGCLFILPGAVAMLVLSWLYIHEQTAPLLMAVLYGIRAATVAVVAGAVLRLARRTLKTRLATVWAGLALLLLASGLVPFPVILAGVGLGGAWVAHRQARRANLSAGGSEAKPQEGHQSLITPGISAIPSTRSDLPGSEEGRFQPRLRRTVGVVLVWLLVWWIPVAVCGWLLGTDSTVTAEGMFFSKVAVCTLGGAYAILPYVARQAVEQHAWLTPGEMVDGLAMAESTPGPLVIVLQFVGFLAAWKHPGTLSPVTAGLLGSLISTWVTFAPSFLFVFTGGPWFQRLSSERRWAGALSATSAATVGVLVHLLIWLAIAVWWPGSAEQSGPRFSSARLDWGAIAISLISAIALLRWRISLGWVLTGAALCGALRAIATPGITG